MRKICPRISVRIHLEFWLGLDARKFICRKPNMFNWSSYNFRTVGVELAHVPTNLFIEHSPQTYPTVPFRSRHFFQQAFISRWDEFHPKAPCHWDEIHPNGWRLLAPLGWGFGWINWDNWGCVFCNLLIWGAKPPLWLGSKIHSLHGCYQRVGWPSQRNQSLGMIDKRIWDDQW